MQDTVFMMMMILFGVSAVFRLITHILEIRDRPDPSEEGQTAAK